MDAKEHEVKKRYLLLGTAVLIVVLLVYNINQSFAYSTQAPAGKTGSPGDGSNCSSCHSGTLLPLNTGITTDVPPTG